jgi:ubiquitin-conjugating enzyme E2 W
MAKANKRIQKELERFGSDKSDGLVVDSKGPDLWHVSFKGAVGTIYEGENFTLRVRFTSGYPMESPEVVFLLPSPIHPHIYSNGHICLNILGEDWSPALTAKSVCLSILSMMSSAETKEPPSDNDSYSRSKTSNPKSTRFYYHDDNC